MRRRSDPLFSAPVRGRATPAIAGADAPELLGDTDHVVEVARTHRAFELPEDVGGAVVGPGDEERFAVPAEPDRAGSLPRAQVSAGVGEVGLRGGLESQAAGVV